MSPLILTPGEVPAPDQESFIGRPFVGMNDDGSPFSEYQFDRQQIPPCPYGRDGFQVPHPSRLLILKKSRLLFVGHEDGTDRFLWALCVAPMPRASFVVIPCDEDAETILAVTRKAKPGWPVQQPQWSLPGGKREPIDISSAAAAAREVREETSLEIDPRELWKVYHDVCQARTGFFDSSIFLLRRPIAPLVPFQNREGCQVQAQPWRVLTDSTTGAYPEYNAAVQGAVRRLLTGS